MFFSTGRCSRRSQRCLSWCQPWWGWRGIWRWRWHPDCQQQWVETHPHIQNTHTHTERDDDHPSIFCSLSGSRLEWLQAKHGSPDMPLPSNIFELLLGDPEVIQSQMRYIISPVCSGSTPGSPTSCTCIETSVWKVPRRHPDQMPEPPGSFPHKRAAALLWAPYPISKGELMHPVAESHFERLYPRSHSFCHCPKLMTIGEGWNAEQLVNRKLCHPARFPLHHNGPIQRVHYCFHSTNPPVDLTHHFILTRKQNLEIVELQPAGSSSLFSDLEPWIQTCRWRLSSQPLHIRLQTTPMSAEGPMLTMLLQYPQRASWGMVISFL